MLCLLLHRFQHPPGVGQNIAWALTEELNISRIIDDLWYRDIRYSNYRDDTVGTAFQGLYMIFGTGIPGTVTIVKIGTAFLGSKMIFGTGISSTFTLKVK